VLRGCIRVFLEQEGEDGRVVALLESPGGASERACATCRLPMVRIKLRGVPVDRCDACRFLFLEAGAVALISRRVLISARSPQHSHPLTRRKRLESMLMNPTRHGIP
jgi:Zn-finger nucleic acid-binding protein